MEKIITHENLKSFAYVNEAAVSGPIRGIALSFFADGTVQTCLPDGSGVKLVITGGYPVNGAVRIQVYPEAETEFVLAVRIPGWCRHSALTVCGEAVPVVAGTYAEIKRVWHAGDELVLNMELVTVQHLQDNFVAFTRGPLVLARDARLGEDIFGDATAQLNADGSVRTEVSRTADFPVLLEQKLVLEYGRTTRVIDYASAGKTWDYDSLMSAWMPRTGW